MKLQAYHNDPEFKRAFVAETVRHREQDRFIKGIYSNGDMSNFKGCSIGCSVHSLKLLGRNGMGFGDHAACANALGWAKWLCLLQDAIFENLPEKEHRFWTEELAVAVPVGVDLTPVQWQFCAFLMRENIKRVQGLSMDEKVKRQVINAVQKVLVFHENVILTGVTVSAARSAAESAAWSAAVSAAESAAESAEKQAQNTELEKRLRKLLGVR